MSWLVRIVASLLAVAAIGYFGYTGMEVSHRLVNRHYRNADCRTPSQLGIAYEPINYDPADDEALIARQVDPTSCSETRVDLGDELVTSDGVRLAGWYVPAASGIGPTGPTVVMSHGWTDNKSGVLEDLVLLHDRYNAVLFDFRNHGQSADSQTTQGIHEQRDLAAVLDWLVSSKAPQRLILWGQSMGGHASVNVAADDPRVDALILDSTHPRLTVPMARRIEVEGYPFGHGAALAGAFGAWLRTGVNVMSDDPVDAIDEVGERPVLILIGSGDETIPVAEARTLLDTALAAGVDARLEVCSGAGHAGLNEACPAEYQRWVDQFLAPIAG